MDVVSGGGAWASVNYEAIFREYGGFTEGFDTRDLKEAKALLEELAV